MNSVIAKLCVAVLIVTTSLMAKAVEISLPENELPSESVIAKLDNRIVVLNRTIKKDGRFSVGLGYGNLLDEMFYNGQLLSLDLRYNNSEMGAWGLRYDTWTGGATSYADTFAADVSKLQFAAAPSRQSGAFITRAFDLYYGKVSMGKDVVTPMHISLLAMLGAQNYGSDWLPATQGGGQIRMYVQGGFAIDLQYLFSIYQKVDPTSTNVRKDNGTPLVSSFGKRYTFGQIFQVGISYLF